MRDGFNCYILTHANARLGTLEARCTVNFTVPNLKCIKSKVRNQNHWGLFYFFLEGRAPPFFLPQPYCTYTCKCSILMALTFFSPLPHCSHKYRAVKMQSSWSKLISDTLSGMYYRLRCSPVLDAAAPPKKNVRTRRACVCVLERDSPSHFAVIIS